MIVGSVSWRVGNGDTCCSCCGGDGVEGGDGVDGSGGG